MNLNYVKFKAYGCMEIVNHCVKSCANRRIASFQQLITVAFKTH